MSGDHEQQGAVAAPAGASPAAVVRRFLTARRDRRYDDALAEVAADAVWWSPISGRESGAERVRDMLATADERTDWFASEVRAVEAHGTLVVALVRNRGRRGERELDSEQRLAFRVERGEIAEVRILVDDEDAVREFWRSGSEGADDVRRSR